MHTVDWIVDDPRAVARAVAARFRLPEVRQDFVQDLPTHGYEAVFSRTANRLIDAPTRLEFIAARPVQHDPACSVAPIELADRLQRSREQRTHATVVCASDFDAAVDELHSRGTPVWCEPTCEHLPHPRAWVGWSDGEYVPGHDAGILFELIPTSALGRRVVDSVESIASPPVPRVTRRVHLVADLDAAVRLLDRSCALTPSEPVGPDDRLAATVARYAFRHPTGATFELAQPSGAGLAADYFARWGEGPFLTTIATEGTESTIVAGDPLLPGLVLEAVPA